MPDVCMMILRAQVSDYMAAWSHAEYDLFHSFLHMAIFSMGYFPEYNCFLSGLTRELCVVVTVMRWYSGFVTLDFQAL